MSAKLANGRQRIASMSAGQANGAIPLSSAATAREEVIAKYRAWIVRQPSLIAALHELSGKNLVCWCAPQRCHAEVLIELANRRQLIAIRGGSLCRLPLASRLTESLRTRHRPSQHPV